MDIRTMETPKKIDDERSTWDNVRERAEPVPIDYTSNKGAGKFYKSGNWEEAPGPGVPTTRTYYCESYDPQYGYWMAEVDPVTFREFPGRRVTNVSGRAIGRTYHQLNIDLWLGDPANRVDLVGGA